MADPGGLPRNAASHLVSRNARAFCGNRVRLSPGHQRAEFAATADWGHCSRFLHPRFFLKRMITDRQSRIRVGMPDALDLTVICVEAGLSLDQAMMRVGEDLRHAHPDLSDEFYLMNLELRAGKPRAEALRNLYNRTGVDDIKALVTTLVQTDRFGTSIAQALRVHSDSLRTERRQRAEEQAAKTTIKMVPPLVVFVLPSIIIVTLGPAIIQLYRTLVS